MGNHISRSTLQKIVKGDKKAFDEMFMQYHRKIYFFCIGKFYCKEEAEGIVQEIFIKVWLNRQNIDPDKNFELYLYKITKNHVFNDLRKKLNSRAGYLEYRRANSDNQCVVQNEMEYKELENLFYDSIKNLPSQRRKIFILSKIEGLSYREIAEKLNISVKTVETHMQLALHYMRNVFTSRNLKILIFIFFYLTF